MIDDPVGHAVRLDAACVVINLLDVPGQDGLRRDCLEAISHLRAECDRAGMPLMVEPLAFEAGGGGGYVSSGDIDRICGLVRQAVELGADVIKADPTDDISEYHRVVEVARVPLLLRGGGRVTDKEILERTHAVLEQGAAGIVYGRNVIQHEDPAAMTGALMAVVHDGATRRRGARAPRVSVARIGIVGGGLMGRELAAAIGRWAALTDHPVTPRLEAVCDTSPEALAWFERDRQRAAADRRPRRAARATPTSTSSTSPSRTTSTRSSTSTRSPPARTSWARSRSASTSPPAAASSTALERLERLRPLLERDALLPRRPARLRHDPLRRARRADRGRARVPALQRPRPRQADQLEAPGRVLRRGRRDERPRDARPAPAAAARLAAAQPLRRRSRTSSSERPGPDGEPVRCDTWDNATIHADAGFPLTLATKRIAPGETNTWRHPRARDGRRRRVLHRQPEGGQALRRPRRPPGVGARWRPAASPPSRP